MIVVADTPAGGFNPSQEAVLDRMLGHAGKLRTEVSVMKPSEWQPWMLDNKDNCIVAAGEQASKAVLGWTAPPDLWHGSILPTNAKPPFSWDVYVSWCVQPARIVITYSIENLAKMYAWHPLATRDWEKAGMVARKDVPRHNPMDRKWVVNQPKLLWDLYGTEFAFDTEFGAAEIFGACDSRQVHVLYWSPEYQPDVQKLMASDAVKIAHNLQHDLAMCELKFGVKVSRPYFDTMGGAHILNTELEKSLSPGISGRFTFWPYHKWLAEVDMVHYNGMDNIVCFDGFLEIHKQLQERGLLNVAQHDHDLLEVLYQMQHTGLRVDQKARKEYETEVAKQLVCLDRNLQTSMRPVIHANLSRFNKPHLFQKQRKCPCCGGGTLQRIHCERCGNPRQEGSSLKAWKASLPVCQRCSGSGKNEVWRSINPGSDFQVADVLYRGLGIPPRKYKGVETTRADALAKLASKYPLVAQVVVASKVRADLSTVERLIPDSSTGKLHSVFNPWGTVSGRVSSSEGLLRAGTNLMNIPKPARRFIVPDEGCIFLYPDMSQIEGRAVAVLSKPFGLELWNAYTTPINWPGNPKHGLIDSHTMVQQMMSRWVDLTRDQCKRTTYAVMYGGSGAQLAVELTAEAHRHGGTGFVSEEQGNLIVEAFFLAFPGVKKWQDSIVEELERTRTLRSLTGRERHWPGRIWDKKKKMVFREVAKEGWSFKPQDIAAWVLAEGLIKVVRWNESQQRFFVEPLVHVHDAVVFQCHKNDVDYVSGQLTNLLTQTMFGIDFPCAMKTGTNWLEAS